MQPWKRRRGIRRSQLRFTTRFEPIEREVLGNIAVTVSDALMERARSAPRDELEELTGIRTGHTEAPASPALARLLPDFARPGDEAEAGDNAMTRSLHEADITAAKLRNLREIIDALGPDGSVAVMLDRAEAEAWMAALNDMRLYLHAVRTSGSASRDAVPDEGGSDDSAETTYQWLSFCQDSLLAAVMDA